MGATLPARLGGAEVDYRTMMEIVALLSRGCASTGWVYCNLASCTFKLALWPEARRRTKSGMRTGTRCSPAT